MTPHISDRHGSCYCRRCFSPVTEVAAACPSCEISFTGAGRFERLMGEPPRTPCADLFQHSESPALNAA